MLLRRVNWTVDTPFEVRVNPWADFLTNDKVFQKISNFMAIRGNLHLKFQIAGGPFYSGLLLASYYPLAQLDSQYDFEQNTVQPQYALIPESQRIVGYIDPTTNEGCEITCPYYYPENGLSLVDGDAVQMGELTLRDIARLRSVGETPTTVTVTIFAWMTDVHMIGQTFINPLTTLAQVSETDESGPVSKVSSAVAQVAGKLTQVPVVGKYALATEKAANVTEQVARLFGFSKPMLSDHTRAIQHGGNAAVSNTRFPLYKTTIDENQETTIDPSVAGFPQVDEMAISHIIRRESYLAKCTWQLFDNAGAILFNTKVSPQLYDYTPVPPVYYHTPLSYVAQMFSYWRGPLEFRIEIPASSFHKGKLKISYDSHAHETLDPSESDAYNTCQNFIMDLTESRVCTFTVGWSQTEPYRSIFTTDQNLRFETNAMNGTVLPTEPNGMITITVENQLQAPYNTAASDAQLDVLIFVRAGEDFSFAGPTERIYDKAFGSDVVPSHDEKQHPTPPKNRSKKKKHPMVTQAQMQETTHVSKDREIDYHFGESISPSHSDMIHFGETITSLRQLSKRFTTFTRDTYPAGSETHYPSPPLPKGLDSDMGVRAPKNMTFLHWVLGLFIAHRGSMRYKF